ncbi:hypothetical protein HT136_04535 [Novosphingobium profundi]|nr:hypothetical protein [Novosphingobium profundi]
MDMWILPAIFAVFTVVCLLAGIWLLLHLTALAAFFRGKADVVPSSKPPIAPRSTVVIALCLFGVGLAGVLATQVIAIA